MCGHYIVSMDTKFSVDTKEGYEHYILVCVNTLRVWSIYMYRGLVCAYIRVVCSEKYVRVAAFESIIRWRRCRRKCVLEGTIYRC